MAEIQLKSLAHSYMSEPSGPDDYAIRQLDQPLQEMRRSVKSWDTYLEFDLIESLKAAVPE